MSIKLPKLPDRIPVKVTLSLSPELHKAVTEYADIHREAHGQAEAEPVAAILPFIVQDYLDRDKGFIKARKNRAGRGGSKDRPTLVVNHRAEK